MGIWSWLYRRCGAEKPKEFNVDDGVEKPEAFNIDDMDFGNLKFRAEVASALNMSPSDLSCVGPAFIEAHKTVLRDVWLRVDASREYKSTDADRAYRARAHLIPTPGLVEERGAASDDVRASEETDNTLLYAAAGLMLVNSITHCHSSQSDTANDIANTMGTPSP